MPRPSQALIRERTVEELVAENVLLRRENKALREYNAALAQRIQEIEHELSGDTLPMI